MTSDTTIPAAALSTNRMPSGFVLWAVASSVSAMGSSVMSFGVAWCATGIDPQLAGLIVTLVIAPRVLLLMLGGVVADRVGARRIMMGGDALMCATALLLAVVTGIAGPAAWSLMLVSLIGGAVDAFYLPASGAMPRLFLTDAQVPRGMALMSGVRQIALMAGPPLGAIVVMSIGLAASAVANAFTFAVVLVVLWAVRPSRELSPPPEHTRVVGDIADSIRAIWSDRLVRALLGPVGLLACAVLPMFDLGAPLLVRYRGWGAGVAGMIETAWFIGTLTATVVVARTGTHHRPGLVAGYGPVAGGLGAVAMAVGPAPAVVIIGSVVLGAAVAACTSHIAPVFLMATPSDQVSRFQSVFVLVQMAPLLVANNVFAAIAAGLGAPVMLGVSAALTMMAGGWLLASPTVRHATTRHTEG